MKTDIDQNIEGLSDVFTDLVQRTETHMTKRFMNKLKSGLSKIKQGKFQKKIFRISANVNFYRIFKWFL